METGLAAFRFALVGFTLPYMFVFRPQLLMLGSDGEPASAIAVAGAVLMALLGILPLAAGIAGYLFAPLSRVRRGVLLLSAALLLQPSTTLTFWRGGPSVWDAVGMILLAAIAVTSWRDRNA